MRGEAGCRGRVAELRGEVPEDLQAGRLNRLRAGDLRICPEIFFQLFVKRVSCQCLEKDCSHCKPIRLTGRERAGRDEEGGRGGREEEREGREPKAWWQRRPQLLLQSNDMR